MLPGKSTRRPARVKEAINGAIAAKSRHTVEEVILRTKRKRTKPVSERDSSEKPLAVRERFMTSQLHQSAV